MWADGEAVSRGVENPCGQRAAKDRAGIQADLIAMEKRTSELLWRVTKHNDAPLKVGTAG